MADDGAALAGGNCEEALAGGADSGCCSSGGPAAARVNVDDATLNEELKAIPPGVLLDAYSAVLAEDAGVEQEARDAYASEIDRNRRARLLRAGGGTGGLVNRRAPLNPFASHKLGKYRQKTPGAKGGPKVMDPALVNNPIYGRLLMCLCSNAILMFIYFQSLLANKIASGSYYTSSAENKMIGPQGLTLLNLGALNANYIRNKGEWFRIFWAMWMHSGWIHIGLNVLSQLQNLWMFEPDWGFTRCLFIYCVSGIFGNFTSLVFNPCSTTVGSSGCLFGLMGAMATYCIEFWETIPRPLCVMLFSLIVAGISLILGFTSGTDNWAHMGGLIGGVASSMLTVPRFPRQVRLCGGSKKSAKELAEERDRLARRPARTLTRWMPCLLWSWKMRESVIRFTSFSVLLIYLLVCSTTFFVNYHYQPVGQPTFSSRNRCCCCYAPSDDDAATTQWQCYQCDTQWTTSETYEDWCSTHMSQDPDSGLKSKSGSVLSALGLSGMTQHALLSFADYDTASDTDATFTLLEAAANGSAPYRADFRAAVSPTLQGVLPAPATPFADLLPGLAVAAARSNRTAEQVLTAQLKQSQQRLDSLPNSRTDLQPLFEHELTDLEVKMLLDQVERYRKRHAILQSLVEVMAMDENDKDEEVDDDEAARNGEQRRETLPPNSSSLKTA